MSSYNSLNVLQNRPRAMAESIMTQEHDNETLIYNLKTNKMFHLNETSSLVWQACNGQNSIDQIARKVSQKLNSHTTEDVVWLALQQLQNNGLLIEDVNLESSLNGLSRREMIRRAGLATMVAFPLITSVVAPSAARAASGSPNAGCTSNCTLGLICGCGSSITCSNGNIVNINIGLGVCVTAAVALSTYGVDVGVGAQANVCVAAGVCV